MRQQRQAQHIARPQVLRQRIARAIARAHRRLVRLTNLIQQQAVAGLQAQRIKLVQRFHAKGSLRAETARLAVGQHHAAALNAGQQRRNAHHRVQHFFQARRVPGRVGHLQQRRGDPRLFTLGGVQARFVNGHRNLIGQRAQRVDVLVVEGRDLIALHVDCADHFLAKDQRHRQFRLSLRQRSHGPVALVARHVGHVEQLAILHHPADDALPHVHVPVVQRRVGGPFEDDAVGIFFAHADGDEHVAERRAHQFHGLVEQRLEIENRRDLLADFADELQVCRAPPLLLQQARVGNRGRGLIADDGQQAHMIIGESPGPKALNHQRPDRLIARDERDEHGGSRRVFVEIARLRRQPLVLLREVAHQQRLA